MDERAATKFAEDTIAHNSSTKEDIDRLKLELQTTSDDPNLERALRIAISCLEDERLARQDRVNTLCY